MLSAAYTRSGYLGDAMSDISALLSRAPSLVSRVTNDIKTLEAYLPAIEKAETYLPAIANVAGKIESLLPKVSAAVDQVVAALPTIERAQGYVPRVSAAIDRVAAFLPTVEHAETYLPRITTVVRQIEKYLPTIEKGVASLPAVARVASSPNLAGDLEQLGWFIKWRPYIPWIGAGALVLAFGMGFGVSRLTARRPIGLGRKGRYYRRRHIDRIRD